ncbi:hypothetical protein C7H19_22845 [Aphanothece hegewaldii CCALA 016]|uniref:vWA-MoxR associated protein N-terminal HTH domain-containing protein n=1 Tax=Aphanothece hegewaldii CCALA 016 TaxID=2107694 RepID=A0A2T1LRJ3_9CHRO|nr:hypothetical protein [Aphanothece hegewaldii]PSF31334.1 hypothetical protein C7H19_22845 [Aphanothece hegewaldii CCALA 016]
MDVQAIITYLDELVFKQTGKHLDSLQVAILKGVFNGQKYTDIAKDYNCTAGHTKDEAYVLWDMLSKVLGEDLNKSNLRAIVERVIATNSNLLGNFVQVGSINLCSNPLIEETDILVPDEKNTISIKSVQKIAKLQAVPRLIKLGLTLEQIAEALDLSLDEVQQAM